jgi:hypothetical protein
VADETAHYIEYPRAVTRSRRWEHGLGMCRNIKTLFNFDPPATDEEIRAASLQFVRKLSGIQRAVERQRGGVR